MGRRGGAGSLKNGRRNPPLASGALLEFFELEGSNSHDRNQERGF
jgi:hypothetical protein